jgi:hypothetical protein
MDLFMNIATGKKLRGMPATGSLQLKKEAHRGAPPFVSGKIVCFRVRRTLWLEAIRHSAGWACPTAALFSDALIESRIGRTTNNAIATTMKFITAATANTAYQLPV